MGASLSLTVSESSVNQANNTSVVTATLKITATGATYNGYSRSGYITIDGTKYTFSSSFGKGKTTTLAKKSKTVTHNADGSKTVTVKGYYSTGVSAGNLSKTVTKTLTKINRYNYVSYNGNGATSGVPGRQTKTYGQTLTLATNIPQRTGYSFLYWSGYGGLYNPGSKYTYNVDTTMVAQWLEHTSTLVYDSNGHGEKLPDETLKYTTACVLKSTSADGYTFNGWNTKADGSGTSYSAGDTFKASNVDPEYSVLYAQWTANVYSVTYNLNGGSGTVAQDSATYDSAYTMASSSGISKTGYRFAGWSQQLEGGTLLQPNYTFNWTISNDVTFYAIWEEIQVAINYYRAINTITNFSVSSNYVIDSTDAVLQNSSYVIDDRTVPNLENYTFSGYWTSGSPNSDVITEHGYTFPKGILPYDYIPLDSKYLSNGSIFLSLKNNLSLYPVYRDNSPSKIVRADSFYNYLPYNVSIEDYFLYI